jgi:Leucine-rich repeat (LRR) protein
MGVTLHVQVLYLQGNSIVFLAGLDNSTELRELRLDKNRIRQLDATSTIALHQLRILSMEDNGLKSLANFNNLLSLKVRMCATNALFSAGDPYWTNIVL